MTDITLRTKTTSDAKVMAIKRISSVDTIYQMIVIPNNAGQVRSSRSVAYTFPTQDALLKAFNR